MKVSRCETPDRVPVSLPTGHYAAYYSGYDFKTVMYDSKAMVESWTKFMEDFSEDMDTFMGPAFEKEKPKLPAMWRDSVRA